MGREIPASVFERGDDEGRTWDEMGLGDQPFTPEYDDSPDDYEDEAFREDYEPEFLDEWLWGEAEPVTGATQTRLFEELDGRIRELEDRLYYRRMAIAAGEAADRAAMAAEEADLAELIDFRRRNSEPIVDDAVEPGPSPSSPEEPTTSERRPSPVRQVEFAIREKLTASEMLHWQELQKGTKQTVIAEKLGIKQGAVSKREAKLRDRINAISVETIGRPYPAKHIERGLWARQGRRRGIKAPPGSDK